MILAYSLTPEDDDSNMLGDDTFDTPDSPYYDWHFGKNGVPHPATCKTCGRKTDKNYINPKYKVRKRKRHLTGTNDGYDIVSTKFRSYCMKQQFKGLNFVPLPADRDFFVLRVSKKFTFDFKRAGTRFLQYCRTCRSYFSIVGGYPVCLKDRQRPIRSGIYRTDLVFGSGHEQCPILIVGIDTAESLIKKFDQENILEPIES